MGSLSIMSNNSLLYFMLWFLIQFLLEGDCQDVIFEPRKRHDHTAAIVDDKLYILGGSGYGGAKDELRQRQAAD